jgi:hypothetical protein
MAPEQRDGDVQDARTDVWAAALLLLECVLGRRASADATEALREVEAPAAVRSVLERALSPDPAKRPSTAAQLRDELAVAGGRAATTVDARTKRKRRVVLAGAALVATALAAGVAFAVTRTKSAHPAPIAAAELNERAWHVNFGEMRLHANADGALYGVYDHGNGVLVGTYANDRFVGWWCQEPTRNGPDDAGQVVLHFVRGENRILIEGMWTYGDGRAAAWQDNFYGVSLETPPEYKLEQRMQHHVGCPGH